MVDAIVSFLIILQIKELPLNKHKKGVNVFDVPSQKFNKKLAEYYKEKNLIKVPAVSVLFNIKYFQYANLVKCSRSNELSPTDPDWFFHKAAAVTRQIYITKSKTLGVGSLRAIFGKKYRRGVNANVTSIHAGKIIRDIVGQLKKNGLCENYASTEGVTLGLLITKNGRTQLDKLATTLAKSG